MVEFDNWYKKTESGILMYKKLEMMWVVTSPSNFFPLFLSNQTRFLKLQYVLLYVPYNTYLEFHSYVWAPQSFFFWLSFQLNTYCAKERNHHHLYHFPSRAVQLWIVRFMASWRTWQFYDELSIDNSPLITSVSFVAKETMEKRRACHNPKRLVGVLQILLKLENI